MREHGRKTRIIAASFGLVALVAACGDDDGGSAGSGSVEDWCNALSLSDEGDRVFDTLTTAGPDDVRSGIERMSEIADEIASASPPQIADDASYLTEYIDQLQSSLSGADYVLFDADLSALDTERLETVQANLDSFSVEECGRPFGVEDDSAGGAGVGDSGDSGDGSFDPSAGTIREQLVHQFVAIGLTQEEAECIADGVDPTDTAVLEGDQEAILALFEACDIPLSRLAELGG